MNGHTFTASRLAELADHPIGSNAANVTGDEVRELVRGYQAALSGMHHPRILHARTTAHAVVASSDGQETDVTFRIARVWLRDCNIQPGDTIVVWTLPRIEG